MLRRAVLKLSVPALCFAMVLNAQIVRKTISSSRVDALETPTGSRLQWGKEITTKIYRSDDPFIAHMRELAASKSSPPSEEDIALAVCLFQPTCTMTITSAYQIDFDSDFLAISAAHHLATKDSYEYETVINHPDGSNTKISHHSGNHIVERSNGGGQTVGDRAARHVDIIKTWLRLDQGDKLRSVVRIDKFGRRTRIYTGVAGPSSTAGSKVSDIGAYRGASGSMRDRPDRGGDGGRKVSVDVSGAGMSTKPK